MNVNTANLLHPWQLIVWIKLPLKSNKELASPLKFKNLLNFEIKMYKFIVSILILLVSACTTSPEIERCKATTARMSSERWDCVSQAIDNSNKLEKLERQQKHIQVFQSQCDIIGFSRGTLEHKNCVLQLLQQAPINDAINAEQQRRDFQDLQRALSPNQGVINCFRAPGSPVTTCQ